MMRSVVVMASLAVLLGTASAFTPSAAFGRSTLPSQGMRAGRSTCAVRMSNNMEEISQEEYEELLRAAGRAPAPAPAKKAAPANPFGGLFGGGRQQQQQQAAAYDDDDYGELPPVSQAPPTPPPQAQAPPTPPPQAAPPAPAAPANPFGGLFGGFGQQAPPPAPNPALEQIAAEQARMVEEAAPPPPPPAQQAPPAPSNPFGGLFGGFGAAPAPAKPAAQASTTEVSEAELRELMAKSQKDSIPGYSLSGGRSARAGTPATPPPQAAPSRPAPVAGVKVTTIRNGDRRTYPQPGDVLTMHYVGKLRSNKQVFDSSVKRGQPFEFQIGVGQVIPGWDEGVLQMSLGEKAQLVVSADYGYGAAGQGPIPPNADLIFDVDLLRINGVAARLRD